MYGIKFCREKRLRRIVVATASVAVLFGLFATKTASCSRMTETVEDQPAAEIVETASEAQPFVLYDIPLDEELQRHIWKECEEKGVPTELVLGVIRKESNYVTDALGDNGRSLGLMQIQPRWQQERMEYLGCWNLMDPYHNTTLGIDILAELLATYPTTEQALMVYNAGETGARRAWFNNGIYSTEYTNLVLAYAEQLVPVEQPEEPAVRPVCDSCEADILGDYMYVIDGETYCEHCLISQFRQEIPE